MKNFDRFVGIDWSGAASPVRSRAIALAVAQAGDGAPRILQPVWSRTEIAEWLYACAQEKVRTLAGIDCNFGYSEITGVKQFGEDYTARDLWQAVEDANTGVPNYFAGGYWTHDTHGQHFWREGKMAEGFSMPRRLTEQACGEEGLGWPESPFKLIGAKQVGKGGLSGMRLILDLKARLGDKVALWPFEAIMPETRLVLTEIYPRLFLRLAGHGNAKVRDFAALNKALTALSSSPLKNKEDFSDHQADALVSAAGLRLLCGTGKTVPESLFTPSAPRTTLAREGWIFGVGAKHTCR